MVMALCRMGLAASLRPDNNRRGRWPGVGSSAPYAGFASAAQAVFTIHGTPNRSTRLP
jgi:hypothetical protein